MRGLKGFSLTRCLALLDPLDATAERERERTRNTPILFLKIVKILYKSTIVLGKHGPVFRRTGQDALEAYGEALCLAETEQLCIPLLANRALASLRLDRFSEALADCDRVLRSKPEHAKALFRLAGSKDSWFRSNEDINMHTRLRVFLC